MKNKKCLPQSTGILFIRWNFYNRIAIAVAYFEEGKMVYMTIDKNKMIKLCDNFLPENITYEWISDYPNTMKNLKISEENWNNESIQQNGILEIKKTSPIASKLNRKKFNQYAKHFLE